MRAIAGDERTVPERAVLALVNRRQRDIALPTIEVQSNASETALRTPAFPSRRSGCCAGLRITARPEIFATRAACVIPRRRWRRTAVNFG